MPHQASVSAALSTTPRRSSIPSLLMTGVVAGAQLELECHSNKMDGSCPNEQQFALPALRPIALRVRYVDREAEASHSRRKDGARGRRSADP
jgi:hypothetical protein